MSYKYDLEQKLMRTVLILLGDRSLSSILDWICSTTQQHLHFIEYFSYHFVL